MEDRDWSGVGQCLWDVCYTLRMTIGRNERECGRQNAKRHRLIAGPSLYLLREHASMSSESLQEVQGDEKSRWGRWHKYTVIRWHMYIGATRLAVGNGCGNKTAQAPA